MEVCSVQGSADLNEDAVIVNENDGVYGVADGATSLTGYRNEAGHTGGYIAAHLLAAHLRNVPSNCRLEDAVIGANEELRERMIQAGIDVGDKRQLWAAAFVAVRLRDTYVEYVQAGDCMLFAKYSDGTFRQVTRDQVAACDRLTLNKRQEAVSRGIAEPAKIREYMYPTLCENRRKANTAEGYAVMNGDTGFRDYFEAGRLSRACLVTLYAVTDGLFHVLDSDNPHAAWLRMLTSIDEHGLEGYAAQLVRIEQEDAACTKYPRLKVSDDKSGIVLHLGHTEPNPRQNASPI